MGSAALSASSCLPPAPFDFLCLTFLAGALACVGLDLHALRTVPDHPLGMDELEMH